MGLLTGSAQRLYRMGLRKSVAGFATLFYGWRTNGRQRFLIDAQGRWVNRQPEATVVSPIVHTTAYAAYWSWVSDNWCWQYRPREGDTIIDVGAGVGEEAIIFSHLVGPSGRVFSIEAHPATFACLQETIWRSGLLNVTPLCLALADVDGSARIVESGSHLTSSIVTGSGGQEVPQRSLDSLACELGLSDIALVKMNIEGAERLATRGMAKTAPAIGHLVISCHDFLAEREGVEALRTKCEVATTLCSFGFHLRTRPDHADAWVRDYFYGSRK